MARHLRLAGLLALVVLAAVLALGGGRASAGPTNRQGAGTGRAVLAAAAPPTAPTTAPGPAGTNPVAPTPATGGGCGLFDVTCYVSHAIEGFFVGMVDSALGPVLSWLSRSVLATPDVTTGQVAVLWGVAAGIANSLVVLFVVVGGAVLMSHETLQGRYELKELAPRVVVAVVAANASLLIVSEAVPF
ncbi:MAG TPA: hypothetical protein VED59_08385, partial [Acidimicrobiales bacterium]|nr:hypothetical protein [Acidimicrobiales bacterium]